MNRPDSSRPAMRGLPSSQGSQASRSPSPREANALQGSKAPRESQSSRGPDFSREPKSSPGPDLSGAGAARHHPPHATDAGLLKHPDIVLCDLRAGGVRQLYQIIAAETAARTGLEADYLHDRLMDLEDSASSGVGGGVAIPHLRLKRLERPFLLFAGLAGRIDFRAVDGEPVDMVALLLSPAADVADHLRRLAQVSRLMRDEGLMAKLRSVDNPDGIRALLIDRQTHNLAA